MFFYSSAPSAGDFKGDVRRMDANKHYLTHHENRLYLLFMIKEGSPVDRRQAEKELEICNRKLTFWSRHPNYDEAVVRSQVEKQIRNWQGRV